MIEMEMERQVYEIPGRQLGWRVSQLQAQGLPYEVQRAGGGIYIIVVHQPPGAQPFAYQPARPRFRLPTLRSGDMLRWVLALAAVALVCCGLYLAFGMVGGDTATAEVGGMRLDPATGHMADDGGLWGWLAGVRLPWQSEGVQQPAQAGGFRWPWDAAADSLAATAETVQGTVTLAAGAVLAVLVLLIVLSLVRRGRR